MYPCSIIGSAQVVTNPTNLTVCLGSPARFTCVINRTDTAVDWLINGSNSLLFSQSQENTTQDGLIQSTLTISTGTIFYETAIACQYNDSSQLVQSSSAFLRVQGYYHQIIMHTHSNVSFSDRSPFSSH